MCCLRVELGDYLSMNTVLFSMVTAFLFELLECIICVISFPASALILFSCEQSVYSIDTNHFYAKLICSTRENIFRWLCWIWEPVKLIIPAFSYQIVDCSILVPCSPSGVDVFLSREGKKIQSLSLSALVLQEVQRRGM